MTPLDRLRARARHATLFPPTTLAAAIHRLGFVQADPIRAPARAQDLILRHRVRFYRAGMLDRAFPRLGLEEDFLYAYGFMPAATREALHPRAAEPLPPFEAEVLAFVRARRLTHPRDLAARFGAERALNAWGGYSKATTRALEHLHHLGLLRVARRQDGIRVYTTAPAATEPADRTAQAHRAVLLVAEILAPVSVSSLRGALALMARRNAGMGPLWPVVQSLTASGMLVSEVIDGETYLAPPAGPADDAPNHVRLLAPFDPLVWDRRRFEHLWGWRYRFEAYTPPPRRQFGYYALPLLWRDAVIGWANLTWAAGQLGADIGYAVPPPRSQSYRRALDAELDRMRRFLCGPAGAQPAAATARPPLNR